MQPMNVGSPAAARYQPVPPQQQNGLFMRNPYGPVPVGGAPQAGARRAMPQANTGAPAARVPDPSPQKSSSGSSSNESGGGGSEVDLNGSGALYRMMIYCIAADDQSFAEVNPGKTVHAMRSLLGCVIRAAFYPLVIQTVFLIIIGDTVRPSQWPDEPVHDLETRCVIVLAVVIYFWSIIDLFFSHILRLLHTLTHARLATGHAVLLWLFFAWEFIALLVLLVLGTWFLVLSETSIDAILNALALNYVLEIDDMLVGFTSSLGGLASANVPDNLILSDTNLDWPSGYRICACIAVNLVNQPVLPLAWGLLWAWAIDGVVENDKDVPTAMIALGSGILLVLLTSHSVFSCCSHPMCCDSDDQDSSSSDDLYDMHNART